MAGKQQTGQPAFTREDVEQLQGLDDYERRRLLAQAAAEGDDGVPHVARVATIEPGEADPFAPPPPRRPREQWERDLGRRFGSRSQAEEWKAYYAGAPTNPATGEDWPEGPCRRRPFTNTLKELEGVEVNGYYVDTPYLVEVQLPENMRPLVEEKLRSIRRYDILSTLYADRLNRPPWAVPDARDALSGR